MSKPLVVTIPHELGRAEARRRLDEGIGGLVAQLGAVGQADHAWDGDVLRFSVRAMGQVISGLIDVADREVRMEVVLPAFLAMIANKVRGKIEKQGHVLLEHRPKG